MSHKIILTLIVVIIILLIVFLYVNSLSIREYLTVSPNNNLTKLHSDLEAFSSRYKIPVMQIMVLSNGNNIYTNNKSSKDVLIFGKKMDINVDNNSVGRIASVTKTITAVGILYLVDQGKLNLDDKMINILINGRIVNPNQIYDKRMYNITIRQLLDHSGGFDSNEGLILTSPFAKKVFPETIIGGTISPFDVQYDGVRIATNGNVATTTDLIRFMMQFPLNFTPGSKSVYSNFSYNLLGRISEVISEQSYETFILNNIFSKIDVQNSPFIGSERIEERRADEIFYYDGPTHNTEYSPDSHMKYKPPLSYGSFILPLLDSHGGFVTSASDLAKFGNGIINYKFFGQNILNEILKRPTYIPVDAKSFYSLGMNVKQTVDGDVLLSHSGALTLGSFSFLGMFLKKKIVIAAIMNHLDEDYGKMISEFNTLITTPFNTQ